MAPSMERYNKRIAAGGGYFEGEQSFMCVLSIKVPIRLKTYLMILVCIYHHHHVALVARIPLTLSRHSSLSFIALGRSSGQHAHYNATLLL